MSATTDRIEKPGRPVYPFVSTREADGIMTVTFRDESGCLAGVSFCRWRDPRPDCPFRLVAHGHSFPNSKNVENFLHFKQEGTPVVLIGADTYASHALFLAMPDAETSYKLLRQISDFGHGSS